MEQLPELYNTSTNCDVDLQIAIDRIFQRSLHINGLYVQYICSSCAKFKFSHDLWYFTSFVIFKMRSRLNVLNKEYCDITQIVTQLPVKHVSDIFSLFNVFCRLILFFVCYFLFNTFNLFIVGWSIGYDKWSKRCIVN